MAFAVHCANEGLGGIVRGASQRLAFAALRGQKCVQRSTVDDPPFGADYSLSAIQPRNP